MANVYDQTWNAADLARFMGVNENTMRRYLDWMTQAYLVRQLQPWFANPGKRQVKAPKIYLRDFGLLHELLGIAVQQHADISFARVKTAANASLPPLVKDEFDAFLQCGILAHGFLPQRPRVARPQAHRARRSLQR